MTVGETERIYQSREELFTSPADPFTRELYGNWRRNGIQRRGRIAGAPEMGYHGSVRPGLARLTGEALHPVSVEYYPENSFITRRVGARLAQEVIESLREQAAGYSNEPEGLDGVGARRVAKAMSEVFGVLEPSTHADHDAAAVAASETLLDIFAGLAQEHPGQTVPLAYTASGRLRWTTYVAQLIVQRFPRAVQLAGLSQLLLDDVTRYVRKVGPIPGEGFSADPKKLSWGSVVAGEDAGLALRSTLEVQTPLPRQRASVWRPD